MKNRLISIVLPVYNGAEHMSKSIESILNQTYQNWELIIVDDCSTDDTLAIAKSYQCVDSRIQVISNERNMKLPSTLNNGFERAKGDYYTWTSDDNMYKPDALDRLQRVLEENSEYVMVYSDYTNIDSDDKKIGKGSLQEPEFIVCGNVCGACFLYRADVSKKIGEYDPELFLAEDYDYWIRLYREGKLKHIKENLYSYRRHGASLSEKKKEYINQQTYRALEKNFLFLYTIAKKNRLQYRMFDYMLSKVDEKSERDVTEMLSEIDCMYRVYLRKQNIKKKLRSIVSFGKKLL